LTEFTGVFDNNPMSNLGVVLIFLLLIASCGGESSLSRVGDEVPYYVAKNYEQITVSPQGRAVVKAGAVEAFQREDKTVFFEAELKEYDSDGELLMEGRAEKVELWGGNDAAAQGDIYVRDFVDNTSLKAEKLTWENRERLLSGEGMVSIEFKDGVKISGEGFVADVARDVYEFKQGARGAFETDEQ